MQPRTSKPTPPPTPSNVVSTAVLSKGVSGKAPSSQSWPDGYVLVPKNAVSATSPTLASLSTAAGGLRTDGGSSGGDTKTAVRDAAIARTASRAEDERGSVRDASDKCKPVTPARLVNPPNPTEEDLVRSAILGLMPGGRLRTKRAYEWAQTTPTNGTEAGAILNDIGVGTGIYQRVGAQIRCTKIIMRFFVYIYHNSATYAANANFPPVLHVVLKRVRCPSAVGSADAAWNVDANPPGQVNTPFSLLGAASLSTDMLSCAVVNPSAAANYHVYGHQTVPDYNMHHPATAASTLTHTNILASGTTYSVTPHMYKFTMEHNLDFITTFDVASGANPLANQLDFSYLAVFDTNSVVKMTWVSELHFEDIVTDGV